MKTQKNNYNELEDIKIGTLKVNSNGNGVSEETYEQRDSIKVIKNTKGYNWEIKLIAKDGVDVFTQLDFVRDGLEQRIKKWTFEDTCRE